MAQGRLTLVVSSESGQQLSAPNYGADFLYEEGTIRDFVFDQASESGKALNFNAIHKLHNHLRYVVDGEIDVHDRVALLGDYASVYRQALYIPPSELDLCERSMQATSGLFLSNVAALAGLRMFIVDRFWAPKRMIDDRAKKQYLEKRKIYQDDVDRYFDYFNGHVSPRDLEDNLLDIANSARLLVSRRDWVGAITNTNNHEFLGSVLSERVVKHSLRSKFPETRYGTVEEDSSPTKADVVVPLGQSALHLQVKMRMNETDFKVHPDRTPMGVVVPMRVLRSSLTKPERNHLVKAVILKIEEIAA
jgi:hypothetical protein